MAGKSSKLLQEKLSDLLGKRRIIDAQIDLLNQLLTESSNETAEEQSKKGRAKRSNVKSFVVNLLEEAGSSGLNSALIVELAEKRGTKLERGSVSSLLSRLKNEGTLDYNGERYALKKLDEIEETNSPNRASKGIFG